MNFIIFLTFNYESLNVNFDAKIVIFSEILNKYNHFVIEGLYIKVIFYYRLKLLSIIVFTSCTPKTS